MEVFFLMGEDSKMQSITTWTGTILEQFFHMMSWFCFCVFKLGITLETYRLYILGFMMHWQEASWGQLEIVSEKLKHGNWSHPSFYTHWDDLIIRLTKGSLFYEKNWLKLHIFTGDCFSKEDWYWPRHKDKLRKGGFKKRICKSKGWFFWIVLIFFAGVACVYFHLWSLNIFSFGRWQTV